MNRRPTLALLACLVAIGLAATTALLARTAEPVENAAPKSHLTTLEPFKVHGDPINSFGFDIAIYWDRTTRKVTRMFITKVHPDSDAIALDLQAGDEIRKINGRAVQDFAAAVDAESELGKIFILRAPGEKIDLDVIRHRADQVTLTARHARAF